MNSDWSYAIDMCAAHGIIDYDAAADIVGQKPRFVGNPKMAEIPPLAPQYLPKDTKMQDPLETDEFVKPNDNLVQNPKWKQLLMGGIAIAGIGAGIAALIASKGKFKLPKLNMKMPSFKMPKIKMPKFKMPNWSGVKTSVVNGAKTVLNYIKKPFVYLANLIKRKP